MILDLEQALEEPVDLSQSFDVPVDRLDRQELVSLGGVEFAGRLQKTDPGFVLTGRLRLTATLSCARCLSDLSFAGDEPVSWTFTPAHRAARVEVGRGKGKGGAHSHAAEPEEEVELSASDLDTVVYDDFQVPFDPLIEEEIQLMLPMKPLCREGCRGLCPTCGKDLNGETCDCRPPEDDRWAALRELKELKELSRDRRS